LLSWCTVCAPWSCNQLLHSYVYRELLTKFFYMFGLLQHGQQKQGGECKAVGMSNRSLRAPYGTLHCACSSCMHILFILTVLLLVSILLLFLFT
jgi:hypothetical protein